MILTKEQFNGLLEAFGPCTTYYECINYIDAQKAALEYETLEDYVKFMIELESIWFDRYRGANDDWTQNQLDDSICEEKEIINRINEWLKNAKGEKV